MCTLDTTCCFQDQWSRDGARVGYLSGHSPSRRGGVYIPTSASLWTAPADPAFHVPDALFDPTAALLWLDAFGRKNWDPRRLESTSCPEVVAGSTSCSRIWSECCGLGIPQSPGHITDIGETDLGRNFQKAKKHNRSSTRTYPPK